MSRKKLSSDWTLPPDPDDKWERDYAAWSRDFRQAVAEWAAEDEITNPDRAIQLHQKILGKVLEWPDEIRMEWEEMAAVLEYDQGNDRTASERAAFWRIKKTRGL
jgi:hypothetical protein